MSLNRQWISFHLEEAQEELVRILECLSNPDYDEVEYRVNMQHLFHHINTAWNARSVSDEQTAEGREEDFHKHRKFPSDLDI